MSNTCGSVIRRSLLLFQVLYLLVEGQQQETLYGLPPIPGEPLPTTKPPVTTTHRVFRFGPFLPYLHHPHQAHQAHALPVLHPTLPPFLAHPFDTYNNINPIPELPPRPEAKYNGYYDLDGNFVSYTSDRARGYAAGKVPPQVRPKREIDPKDEALRQKLLEEEYAYDEESRESTVRTTTQTSVDIKKTTVEVKSEQTITQTATPSSTQKSTTTSELQTYPATQLTQTASNSTETSKSTTVSVAVQSTSTSVPTTTQSSTTTKQQTAEEVKPTQLPTRPLFVSGNAKSVKAKSNIVQNHQETPRSKSKMVDNQVTFNNVKNASPRGPYQVNKKPTQISSQQFSKGLIVPPRQHQRPIQNRPSPNLQTKFINTHKRIRTSSFRPPTTTTQRPRLPQRQPQHVSLPRRPSKLHQRQFQPSPLKVAPQQHQNQQFFPNQQFQQPQFIPLQQQPQRAWAAPSVPDTRDPQVIAYLRDIEDYDWTYTGERPNLERPARVFQEQIAPETLIPLNSGLRQQALVASTLAPYIPPQATASYTAPPPQVQQSPAAPQQPYSLSPAFTPAPGADFLGLFGGTPHPLLDIGRLFGGGANPFGGRR